MIPKVIHYCWFGKSKKPKLVKDCILSWKKHLPDYEIIEWNETNSDLSLPFVREAYKQKKWAFVADYIRLKVLYENGGVYLDTDMLVLKPLDSLLSDKTFIGAECLEFINCAILGTVSKNEFIYSCFQQYENITIAVDFNWGLISIPRILTAVFRDNYSFKEPFDKIIQEKDIVIYPPNYFYALPYENKYDASNYKKHIQKESFAIHLWISSWVEHNEFYYLKNGKYRLGFKKILANLLVQKDSNYQYFRDVMYAIKQSFSK